DLRAQLIGGSPSPQQPLSGLSQEASCVVAFFSRARSTERQLVRALDAPRVIGALRQKSTGETLRPLVDERIVHEKQRLQGRRTRVAFGCAGVRVGTVEQRKEGMLLKALGHQVDAASPGIVNGFERVMFREFPGRLVGKRMRPARRLVEPLAQT